MKNLLKPLLASLLLAWISTPLLASDWAPIAHLEVQGEASLSLDADRVNIHASFSEENRDSRLALQELEADFGRLLRKLQRHSNETISVEAGQLRVYPRRQRQGDQWQISGYQALRDVQIKAVPVEEAGEWLDMLAEASPSQLGPLQYYSTQAAETRNPALAAALEDARDKASTLADTLGQSLGKALEIEEISSPNIQPRQAVMMAEAGRQSDIEVQPGKVEAQARVRVVFELLD
ncbi:SIMPL domain-containing protein [Marinospirillum perlucidum]|uniref:SIMPL domain-containing protein n=1 Tax=Marinospirillum perlucidum TaxID=1982602 RepID=UPI00138FE4E7|nr:SIMPL domain-containing protein [Marinospirillum perlucidum]